MEAIVKLRLNDIQRQLKQAGVEGWLLYDFRRSNDLACGLLGIGPEILLTRRFFYWIPSEGEPVKITHVIEGHSLRHLPGKEFPYLSWQQMEQHVAEVLRGKKVIVMEYSPRNAIPTVSKVDGGTLELVRGFGVEVRSSADLIQRYTSVWTPEQFEEHLMAAKVLDEAAADAWEWITKQLTQKNEITEYDVQQRMVSFIQQNGCIVEDVPICAVNAHSADPHYTPTKAHAAPVKYGDFILIDLWCKRSHRISPYADITRVGVANKEPTARQKEIFDIVKRAQHTATEWLRQRFERSEPVHGWEVDEVCRRVIQEAGYGLYFLHRTGHSIDVRDHGSGANIDNLETQDQRRLIPCTCFSIEPGIYLPGEFGVRLEYDVYIDENWKVHVTGGIQSEIKCLV